MARTRSSSSGDSGDSVPETDPGPLGAFQRRVSARWRPQTPGRTRAATGAMAGRHCGTPQGWCAAQRGRCDRARFDAYIIPINSAGIASLSARPPTVEQPAYRPLVQSSRAMFEIIGKRFLPRGPEHEASLERLVVAYASYTPPSRATGLTCPLANSGSRRQWGQLTMRRSHSGDCVIGRR